MTYVPITPFRRTVDAAILRHQNVVAAPTATVNKWDALRTLAIARGHFGLTDRDLSVLQTLVSFHQITDLAPDAAHVVFPSNAAICARLNGMPCSTMRRHVANLVRAGIIIRRDSPNGKRYQRRGVEHPQAFGFDIAPLVQRYPAFCEAAEAVRAEAARIEQIREDISLMRRDLSSLAAHCLNTGTPLPFRHDLDEFQNALSKLIRRKLSINELQAIHEQILGMIANIQPAILVSSVEMSINDAENEHHYHKTNSEIKLKKADKVPSPINLHEVLNHCSEIRNYAPEQIDDWQRFIQTAETIRPMMGVSTAVWDEAKQAMGLRDASVALAAMLQNYSRIKSPGGYLRALSSKAASCAFSVMSMIRNQGRAYGKVHSCEPLAS